MKRFRLALYQKEGIWIWYLENEKSRPGMVHYLREFGGQGKELRKVLKAARKEAKSLDGIISSVYMDRRPSV